MSRPARPFGMRHQSRTGGVPCLVGGPERLIMIAVLPQQGLTVALLASAGGIATSWLTGMPFGLLAPVAALFLMARGRIVTALAAALAVAFAVAVLAAFGQAGETREVAVLCASFLAAALCLGAIVRAGVPAPRGPAPQDALASPSAILHPDDRLAAARAFWTGVPQVMRYRQHQPDGGYRWTETRSEPGHTLSVDIEALAAELEQPVTASRPDASETEAVRAARIVEQLFGNAWAFDAEGQWSYLPIFAQTTLGFTPEALNAALTEGGVAWKPLLHPDEHDHVAAEWRRCLATGDDYNAEFRIRRASGVHAWARTAARPTRDGQGRITGWYGTSMDIDVHRKTVDSLRDRERELSQLVDLVPSHLWRLTPDGEPTFFNRRMVDYLGMEVADMGRPGVSRLEALIETIHPDDAEEVAAALRRCLTTGEPFAMRYRMRRADGVHHWMSSRAEPFRDPGGRIVQWYGLCHDIDEQVKAEEVVRESERRLQEIIDAVPVHIWSWTPSGGLAYVSRRYLEHLNLSGADFEDFARVAQELVHPDDSALVQRLVADGFRTGEAFVIRYRRRSKDGSYRWTEGRCEPLRDRDGTLLHWYGVSLDIDEQVRADEALRSSKRQLEQMIDAVPVNILSFSPSGSMTYASRRYLEKVGSPPPHIEDFAALARDVAHPDDFPTMFRRASDGFATGTAFVNRFRRREKDGVYRWIEARAQPLRDADGGIVQWYIASIDIEDEMRAQEALRASERTLSQLVATLPALIYCAAPDGTPTYRSRQLSEFLGFGLDDKDEAGTPRLASTLDAIIHPDDLATVRERYGRSLATGEPYALRHRLRRFDGAYRWVETRAAAMRDAQGAIVQWNGVCIDIEDQVRDQEELRLARDNLAKASQAASLAELSASIAHEVNQPLAAIVANAHACQRWLVAEPPNVERAQRTVGRVIRDANAAADVVGRIRALFRQSVGTRTRTQLAGLVADACELMAEEALRRGVQIDVEVEGDLPPVVLDPIQLQQVLVNLMRNGMEAMVGGARDGALRIRASRADDMARVEVGDRGPGIASPERMFEPFFTTKEQGMGMGLAICRSIVELHGGRLWAERNEPQGALLVFTLPLGGRAVP